MKWVLANEEGGNVTTDDFHDATAPLDGGQILSETDKPADVRAEQAFRRQDRTDLILQDEKRVTPNAYSAELMELCHVKASDFRLLGYEEVTADTVWDCVKSRNKGDMSDMSLHQMVDAILSLQIGTLMNYLTISAYKGEFLNEEV